MERKARILSGGIPALLLAIALLLGLTVTVSAESFYVHDPMKNPKAAKDIIVDTNAVYGYAANPDSERLKDITGYDLTDRELVESLKEQREAYHESLRELYDIIADMKARAKETEAIARAVSTRRNELRMESYRDDPEELEKVKKSNLENYGNENGGTPDFFYEKYGSWETVIEKSLSTNEGADAILGLYDKYYDTYILDYEYGDEDDTCTVVSGDSLYLIAKKMLGDGALWTQLYELNKDQIHKPDLIFPGQVLRIA